MVRRPKKTRAGKHKIRHYCHCSNPDARRLRLEPPHDYHPPVAHHPLPLPQPPYPGTSPSRTSFARMLILFTSSARVSSPWAATCSLAAGSMADFRVST
ncbi:hypothetical protein A2U01_0041060, partial [Trifolium medium]|nr:hypothetical protein [Trifolium medium]